MLTQCAPTEPADYKQHQNSEDQYDAANQRLQHAPQYESLSEKVHPVDGDKSYKYIFVVLYAWIQSTYSQSRRHAGFNPHTLLLTCSQDQVVSMMIWALSRTVLEALFAVIAGDF
jgi:hypothetical protein